MTRLNLLVALALIIVANRSSSGAFTTIVDNGPSSNRVDIVFLGDGYTEANIAAGLYDDHINNYLNHVFANSLNAEPFFRYRNFFNVHSVEVVSNESGADVPPLNIFRDTALDASYYFNGSMTERLLSIDTTKANEARDAALLGADFSAEMQYATVNDTRYGGGGGSYAVFAGANPSAAEIALHEIAHSFSHLDDEYGGSPGPYIGGEPSAVNVTTDPTGAKWSQWHGYDQPGIGVIGAYEGGRYYDTGIYRPSDNSKMRSLNRPFDAVSREKIIHDIYNLVDPFDSWRENGSTLVDPGELFVNRIDDNVIELEWYVDGRLVPAANGDAFDPTDFGYGPGDYVIFARGFDPTAFDPISGWVRTDQSELEQLVYWNVTLTATLPGDANGDGKVDAVDYITWAFNYGDDPADDPPGAPGNGDFNNDGVVDGVDYVTWAINFGQGPNDGVAVPEPCSCSLLVMGMTALAVNRRKRRC